MDGQVSVSVESTSRIEDTEFVRGMLADFNRRTSGDDNHILLNVIARSADGTICGGLLGGTYWGWLHIDILWVREDLRRHGLGSRLLSAAEAEAIRRGCRHAHVDTFDFQAPGFYGKKGYSVFGEVYDLPPGHRRIYLRKDLTDS